jgi:nucleoside-diphosphate-sugar epimerase
LIRSLAEERPFAVTLGEQIRDYLHVEDVASAFYRLAEQEADGIFNICSGEPIAMRRLMEIVGDIMGRGDLIRFGEAPARLWDPPFICGNNGRLRTIGWAPRYHIREGLEQTVRWWRNLGFRSC